MVRSGLDLLYRREQDIQRRTSGSLRTGCGHGHRGFKLLEIRGNVRQTRKKMFAEKGYDSQLKDFVKAIREGSAPSVTVVDGVRSTMGCLLLMESCRTLEPMKIDLGSYSVLRLNMQETRILLVAPSLDILGGQAVQARIILKEFQNEPGIRNGFPAAQFPAVPSISGEAPGVTYRATPRCYCASLLSRVRRYDIIHTFSAGLLPTRSGQYLH